MGSTPKGLKACLVVKTLPVVCGEVSYLRPVNWSHSNTGSCSQSVDVPRVLFVLH